MYPCYGVMLAREDVFQVNRYPILPRIRRKCMIMSRLNVNSGVYSSNFEVWVCGVAQKKVV